MAYQAKAYAARRGVPSDVSAGKFDFIVWFVSCQQLQGLSNPQGPYRARRRLVGGARGFPCLSYLLCGTFRKLWKCSLHVELGR